MNKITAKEQDVLVGSSILSRGSSDRTDRIDHMVSHMGSNKAYMRAKDRCDVTESQLQSYIDRFLLYRRSWSEQPEECISNKLTGNSLVDKEIVPLSVDIETAAICDLACPFCYRESILTPDKIIDEALCYSIIDQASELGVPSIKFNWRGEPLLHPKLPEFISYAKSKGILETIINTNAVTLSKKKSIELIDSGLDFMIYSFDGGTKNTYEKMRPGRFKKNEFDNVYDNIRNFNELKNKMSSPFPWTKIQMILTEDTFYEQEDFYSLFSDCVDEVTVTQYSERGGKLSEMGESFSRRYQDAIETCDLPDGTPYMRLSNGDLFLSQRRVACHQPFQRLMVTYDGRVAMCCYDWGAMHPVGYVSSITFDDYDQVYQSLHDKIVRKERGYELMAGAKFPATFNEPTKEVSTLREIWFGYEINIVRQAHVNDQVNDISICKECVFKDTYEWVSVE